MTDEQINVAIAEACGWKPQTLCRDFNGQPWPDRVPNYCNDLNAMHEAEKVLGLQPAGRYAEELRNVVLLKTRLPWVDAGSFAHIHATTRQRAEAFLRTLGKWEELEK